MLKFDKASRDADRDQSLGTNVPHVYSTSKTRIDVTRQDARVGVNLWSQ
jgi:hypothetical protein